MSPRPDTDLVRHLDDGGVVVLDGGLSNALEDDGADLSSELWTARLLLDEPERVAAVHEAYFRAGADVATTATYQASVPSLLAAGLDRAEAEALLAAGVGVAREVRDRVAAETGRTLWVAASVGPYGAVLADGSEYTGRYGLTAAQLRDFHAPRLELLAAAGPDVLAVETVPDLDEAAVLVELLDDLGLPAWLSYSVAGDRTRAGQPLTEAYAVTAGRTHLVAAGVNCSAPVDVAGAVRTAVSVTGLPAVAYPNRGETWDDEGRRWNGDGAFDPGLVPTWVAAGARLVGGCCRVGARDVAAIRRALA
ncbi:homocysteine S-methyltransferase [Nocardioides scoriae]|uniref:Homocysteine S-methyltransferase n=1 Tax=Nocardioides scoriae TaxID=642780 RepID=A0A1H1VB61_9ACTN|nr:homocysteine S-methyltransferase [Nocardioides scoriae]SDS81992.1 homocysteine S-methyltransferase [Nocardioides scoriae]